MTPSPVRHARGALAGRGTSAPTTVGNRSALTRGLVANVEPTRTLVVAAAFLAIAVAPTRAEITAFTYQGLLSDGGEPASGLHDFRFLLFDAAAEGVQIGSASGCVRAPRSSSKAADRLLTRDRGFYRTWFRGLRLFEPS